jgi:hypothetical protein
MARHFYLSPRQSDEGAILFRIEDEKTGKIRFRPDLAEAACRDCKKIDEMRAFRKGLYNQVAVTVDQDIVDGWELFDFVSSHMRVCLNRIAGNLIEYFEIPGSDYYVALPLTKIPFEINKDLSLSRRRALRPCLLCGRYKELVLGDCQLRIDSDLRIGAIHLENRLGLNPFWVVNEEIYYALRNEKPKLTGMYFEGILPT